MPGTVTIILVFAPRCGRCCGHTSKQLHQTPFPVSIFNSSLLVTCSVCHWTLFWEGVIMHVNKNWMSQMARRSIKLDLFRDCKTLCFFCFVLFILIAVTAVFSTVVKSSLKYIWLPLTQYFYVCIRWHNTDVNLNF